MAEFILHTDPLEFQNTRQSTKIVFLQQEVRQLQDHIRDLEQVVRINKEALKIATSQHFQMMSKRVNQNDTTASTVDTTMSQNYSKSLQQLVEQLQEENSRLFDIVEKVKEERNIAQSRALISEQISEEAQRRETEAVMELEEKIFDLRKLLQDKEYAMQELEKVKPSVERDGVVIKYREVINPTEQTLKLCNEIDSLNGMLAKVSRNLNKAQFEKQNLLNINFDLTTELSKIRAMFSSPLNVPHKYQMMSNSDNLNNSVGGFAAPFVVRPVKELVDDCPSPLPDKVSYPQMSHKKAPVPKLDLTGALKIQENQMNKASQNKPGYVDHQALEKIKQLEEELEFIKKRYSLEAINNRLLSDEVASLEKAKKQILAVNEILVKSNKRYEERLQKMSQNLEYYKDLYQKHIDYAPKHSATPTKTATSTNFTNSEKCKNLTDRLELEGGLLSDKPVEELKEADEDDGKEVNVSILDAREEETHQQQQEKIALEKKGGNNIFEFTKEQCKFFLLNLAKDLYVNTNINKSSLAKNILKKLEFGRSSPVRDPVIRLQRSVSNALDYVSERKKLIFEPEINSKEKKQTKLRKQKKCNTGDQNKHGNSLVTDNIAFDETVGKFDSPLKDDGPFFGYAQEEMISFNVDAEEFNKQKVVDVSFISNNEILDQIRHD